MNNNPAQTTFWVGDEDAPMRLTADQILMGLEAGNFDANTPVRIQQSADPKPLARYVRELVWMAHRQHAETMDTADNRTLFQAAFDGAPIGVVLSDLAGRLTQANEAFCHLLGYAKDELQGMRVGQISETADHEREVALGNDLLAGKRSQYQIEKRFRRKDGRPIDTYTAISMVRSQAGLPSHVIAHVMDLTEYKKLEQSRQLAEAQSKAKSAFLSNMSHEIRTPLNAIIGYTQLLQREEKLSTEQRDYINTIDQSGKHLLALINAVLDMAMIEAGQESLVIQEFDLHELLNGLVQMFTPMAAKKDLHFRLDNLHGVPRWLKSDATKIRQILINIIGNAIKFTASGSVTIYVFEASRASGESTLRFRVQDTGCGITSDEILEIFRPSSAPKGPMNSLVQA